MQLALKAFAAAGACDVMSMHRRGHQRCSLAPAAASQQQEGTPPATAASSFASNGHAVSSTSPAAAGSSTGPSSSYSPPPQLEALLQAISKEGIRRLDTPVVSAHQMGTARMGTRAETSAVDPSGESWDASGLYVADASLFPTSSGANPMVTVQALALLVGKGIAERYGRGAGSVGVVGKAGASASVRVGMARVVDGWDKGWADGLGDGGVVVGSSRNRLMRKASVEVQYDG
jgi:choline dehydrogenase-like flavoprotein